MLLCKSHLIKCPYLIRRLRVLDTLTHLIEIRFYRFRGWLRPVAGAKAEGDGVGDVSLLDFKIFSFLRNGVYIR